MYQPDPVARAARKLRPALHGGDFSTGKGGEDGSNAPPEATLIHSKTRLPRKCGDNLRRERLEKLAEGVQRHLLTLVMAPPGCGKTTLAQQWAERLLGEGSRVAWFSIDADDDDPLRFLLYVRQAIAQAVSNRRVAGAHFPRHDPQRSLTELLSALLNWVAELGDELVIVLDNYSWITDAKIHAQVSQILDNAPANLHLVILASAPPPLAVGRLRARSQLLELNSYAIRFTRPETLQLFHPQPGIPEQPADFDELYRFTHGWAAAVRIIAMTLGNPGSLSQPRNGFVACRIFDAINEYLDELFAHYPDDMLNMMIDTSIVDALSSSLCQALVVDDDDATETYFCQLKQHQILLPLDPEQGQLSYPSPVRRYLYKKLIRKGRHHLSLLHGRAQAWYARHGQWEYAIGHALASGDTRTALGWMESHAMSALKAGHGATLIKWHQELSASPIAIPPGIRLAFAWAYAVSHSLDSAIELLAAIDASPPEVQAECNAIKAVGHVMADHIEEAVEFSARCSTHRFSDSWISGVVSSVQLYCRLRRGEWAAFYSAPTILTASAEGESNTHVVRLSILGLAALLRGQLGLAEKHFNDAHRMAPVDNAKNTLHFSAWPMGLLACVYYEQRRFGELDPLLAGRLEYIASSSNLDCVMAAFLSAARAAATRGKQTEAFAVLEKAERIAMDRKWTRLVAAVLLERLRLYLGERRLPEAEGCLERMAQLPRDNGSGAGASSIFPPDHMLEIARAYLAIHTSRADEAIASLLPLISRCSGNGNEFLAVRLGALLSIAYQKSGQMEEAEETFLQTMEKAEKGGFVSAVIDQGLEIGFLLSRLSANLQTRESEQRLRRYSERLLREWEQVFGTTTETARASAGKPNTAGTLTAKEQKVITLLAQGQSNKEIARSLSVAPETIKTHLKNIFQKLAVERRVQAIAKAQSLGLLAGES